MLKHVEKGETAEDERPESEIDFRLSRKVSWYHVILLNRPLKFLIILVLASIIAPTLIFLFFFQNVYLQSIYSDGYSIGICSHRPQHRVQCSLDEKVSEGNCSKNCCYDEENEFCYHYVPSRYSFISKNTWQESMNLTPRVRNIPYAVKPNLKSVRLHLDEVSEKHFKFMLYNPNKVTTPTSGELLPNKNYFYKIFYPEIFIEVFSEDKNITKPLLSTARGPLIVADNFWEWNFHISDVELYGFGSIILEPRLLYSAENNTHVSPFFMSQRNGSYHGVFLEQDGPLEVTTTPSKVVSVKSITGDQFGVHFFYGPKPSDVVEQFNSYVGVPDIPPYWALGVHFCRGNMTTSRNVTAALEEFYKFTEAAKLNKIPYDSDCIADGLFDFINFDMTPEDMGAVRIAVDTLKSESREFLPTLRPHVKINKGSVYAAAVEAKILILWPNKTGPYKNTLFDVDVAFPDYSIESTIAWLAEFWPFSDLTQSFVLSDNWPKVDNATVNCSVILPYVTDEINATLCETISWNATHPLTGERYMVHHNMYGKNHARAVRNLNQDPNQTDNKNLILSASSFPGIKTGIHIQNVTFTWDYFKKFYSEAVWNSMQGHHINSLPVCGDTASFEETEAEQLCIKWYLASVFLPVFRVVSNTMERHPLAFSGFARTIMLNAIKMRYKLLPYFYSAIQQGKPMIRPLFYEFPNGNDTIFIDTQYAVGDAIILAPVFRPAQSSVSIYLANNETVYDLWGGNQLVNSDPESLVVDIPILENELVTLLRAGFVVPIQETIYQTATETRMKSNFTLIVALNCTGGLGVACVAEGSLFISNTTQWLFEASETTITIHHSISLSRPTLCMKPADGEFNELSSSIINRVRIYGLDSNSNNMGEFYLITDLSLDICDLETDDPYTFKYK